MVRSRNAAAPGLLALAVALGVRVAIGAEGAGLDRSLASVLITVGACLGLAAIGVLAWRLVVGRRLAVVADMAGACAVGLVRSRSLIEGVAGRRGVAFENAHDRLGRGPILATSSNGLSIWAGSHRLGPIELCHESWSEIESATLGPIRRGVTTTQELAVSSRGDTELWRLEVIRGRFGLSLTSEAEIQHFVGLLNLGMALHGRRD